jgi:hypothetical protein
VLVANTADEVHDNATSAKSDFTNVLRLMSLFSLALCSFRSGVRARPCSCSQRLFYLTARGETSRSKSTHYDDDFLIPVPEVLIAIAVATYPVDSFGVFAVFGLVDLRAQSAGTSI